MKLLPFYKKYKVWIYLSLIWFVALFLRIYKLGSLPVNLMEDEVLSGYVGRYILQNGVDLYGNAWPMWYFDKFGDYYIIGPMYLAGLSTYIFGVTEFAVRFPAASIGSLVVFPVFSLVRQIFKKNAIALIASFFIAILPWHVVLSRSSAEGIIGTTIFLTGICFILYSVRKLKMRYLYLSSPFFLLSYFIYHPFRLYVPMVFLVLFISFSNIRKISFKTLQYVLITVGFVFLTGYISTTPWGSGRFEQTSIFSPLSGVERKIQEQIFATGEGNVLQARVFHNKLIGYAREYVSQYVTYVSPSFLLSSFGSESRYSVPDQGLLFYTIFLLILIGIAPVYNQSIKGNRSGLTFFLLLFLIIPAPPALTYYGSPNIHRSVFMTVLLVVPAAIGAYKLLSFPFRKIITLGLGLLLLLEFAYFWHQYSVQSDLTTSLQRNDGYKEMISYVKQNQDSYDKVYIPAEGTTSLYYLFYSRDFNPSYAGAFGKDARIEHIGPIYFSESSCPESDRERQNKSILFVNRYDCPEVSGSLTLKRVYGRNELLGFRISAFGSD